MSTPTPDRTYRVAVVIPAYNHVRYVAEAVASAAEIVVVDDGSSRATAEGVRGIAEPRLRLITQTNRGPSAARNRGWRSTSSPWIFFLDADDTLAPDALPALLSAVVPGGAPEIPYGFQEVYADDFGGAPHFTADLACVSGDLLAAVASGYGATIFVGLFPRTAIEAIGGSMKPSITGRISILRSGWSCGTCSGGSSSRSTGPGCTEPTVIATSPRPPAPTMRGRSSGSSGARHARGSCGCGKRVWLTGGCSTAAI